MNVQQGSYFGSINLLQNLIQLIYHGRTPGELLFQASGNGLYLFFAFREVLHHLFHFACQVGVGAAAVRLLPGLLKGWQVNI